MTIVQEFWCFGRLHFLVDTDLSIQSVIYIKCQTYVFAQSDSRIFWELNFYFMETANIPVYGTIAV